MKQNYCRSRSKLTLPSQASHPSRRTCAKERVRRCTVQKKKMCRSPPPGTLYGSHNGSRLHRVVVSFQASVSELSCCVSSAFRWLSYPSPRRTSQEEREWAEREKRGPIASPPRHTHTHTAWTTDAPPSHKQSALSAITKSGAARGGATHHLQASVRKEREQEKRWHSRM